MRNIEKKLREFYNYIMAILVRMLDNPSDVEEAKQDIYVQAIKNENKIRNFKAWIGAVTHNTAINYNKRRVLKGDDAMGGLSVDPADFESREEFERLQVAIGTLSHIYQEVVLRHYFDGRGVKEIAEELNVPVGTVKRRLHVARQKLQQELKDGV